MRIRRGLSILAMVAAGVVRGSTQTLPSPPLVSPEVGSDRTVTFRFRAPNAAQVTVALEGSEQQPMRKDAQGVWSLTVGPLDPDIYGYSYFADEVRHVDPLNPLTKPNLLNLSSMVHVPGPSSLPWEIGNVPRGAVQRHFYRSTVVGDDRDFFVYTPPGYPAGGPYPVLYLLHGYSDDASAWTAVGRAHIILDNLIAEGTARPMVVVMPLGYGAPEIVAPATAAFRDDALRRTSFEKFRDSLFTEVMPQIEKSYRVSKDRGARAIAGLSMGGAESLFIGLTALDRFAWIGAFSAGGTLDPNLDVAYPALDATRVNGQLRLLWIACGTQDRLIESNRALWEWLTKKRIRHSRVETAGAHTWMVWRRNLATFARLLFKESWSRS
jgi:enterochelin esterase-like enzyme